MGAVSADLGAAVQVCTLAQAERIDLDCGSWSRMVLSERTVVGNRSSLGYSVFTPGTLTPPVAHETEELAYVLSGTGELRLDDGAMPFGPEDGLLIPAGRWHAIAITGSEDVAMVFCFPHPDYPPTERRPERA